MSDKNATKVLCSDCGKTWCVMLDKKKAGKTGVGKCCGHVSKNHKYKCSECHVKSGTDSSHTSYAGLQTVYHDEKYRPFQVAKGVKLPDDVQHITENNYSDDKPDPFEMLQCQCISNRYTCSDGQCTNFASYYECPDDCVVEQKCENQRISKKNGQNY